MENCESDQLPDNAGANTATQPAADADRATDGTSIRESAWSFSRLSPFRVFRAQRSGRVAVDGTEP